MHITLEMILTRFFTTQGQPASASYQADRALSENQPLPQPVEQPSFASYQADRALSENQPLPQPVEQPSFASYQADRALSGIQLLPRRVKQLSPDYLYVSDAISPEIARALPEDSLVLCLCAAPDGGEGEPFPLPPQVICLQTDLELAEGFNQLQQCYQDFIDWGRELDFAIFREASFQELIDLGASLLVDPILIYDPALKLLAYSTNHPTLDDHIFQSAIANGYLDLETVKYFDQDHIFQQMDDTGSAVGLADHFRMHDDLARAINIQNELAVYCVILYANDLPRSYINQLFQLFCDGIERLLKKQHATFLRDRSVSDYLLIDLLDNPATPPKQIRERVFYTDLDYQGNYILISIHSDIRQKASLHYFIQMLRNNLINCRIFSYKQRVVVLYHLPMFREMDYREYLRRQFDRLLADFADRKLNLFFSRPFTTLGRFAAAYTQAENVCRLCKGNLPCRDYFYEDFLLQDLFFMNSSPDPTFSYCHPAILALREEDTKKSRYQLQILYTYLRCDRNFSETANRLNMHRNNVIYHVRQIAATHKLDLEDADVRLKLLLSFALLGEG